MNLTTDIWTTFHSTANFNVTTTAYSNLSNHNHLDSSGRANFTKETTRPWFLGHPSATPVNFLASLGRRNSSISFQRDFARNKTRLSGGNRNLTAHGKRKKPIMNQTCSLFRRIFNTYVVGGMCLLGILGNIVSILVLQKDKNNKVAIFLLQSLAAADVILLMISFLILSVYHGFMVDLPALRTYHLLLMPHILAKVNPIGMVAQAMVIWFTVLLAVNRYIAICKPFAAKRWLTMNWARAQVLGVFIISILLNLPRLFVYKTPLKSYTKQETNTTEYYFHLQRTSLGRNWHFEVYYFHSFYNAFVHALPLLLLVCFNIPIIRNLQRSKRLMQRNSLVYSGRRENNITVIMVIIIVQLLVCHTPDKIACIYRDIITNHTQTGCPHPLYFTLTVANFFVIINSSTDFIVYYLFRKRFRYHLKSRLCCIKNLYYGVSRMSQTEGEFDPDEASIHRVHLNSVQQQPGVAHIPLGKRSAS